MNYRSTAATANNQVAISNINELEANPTTIKDADDCVSNKSQVTLAAAYLTSDSKLNTIIN